ncbi:alkylated DNA nucleotide flippase Atl1 [Friedmanniella endophytica]|uniref:Alkylated DNA nucleotide flippase Atl1 n=1 Tax=Microlunatus kandeliicorticis TaxID=1759536 RepID=A0A7W3P747_9ACTN|nr:MGMT family protein [Microlunatus kandeliicorticis]MBA8795643.1 alkylated DNA nucleotide flippase Atl1 [Microlunatus kandeliicorticis]
MSPSSPPDRTGPDGADERRERYAETVLAAVEQVPQGRATTYGALAALVADELGWGGPRQVGAVLARHGAAVCWWRVVRADGRPARGHETEALRRLAAEGVPLRDDRVALARCRWP